MAWQRVFIGLSLAINVILAYSLVWGENGIKTYRNLKGQHQAAEMRLKELGERSIALSREIRLLQSDAKYQEKIIRERFNFVKDDEVLYLFPGPHDTTKTGAGSHETKN